MNRKRTTVVVLLIIATVVTAAAAFLIGADPPIANVAGSFGAIAALLIVSKLLDIGDDLFYSGIIFVFFASPVGSVLDMYRSFGPYDKIIHFISGILRKR